MMEEELKSGDDYGVSKERVRNLTPGQTNQNEISTRPITANYISENASNNPQTVYGGNSDAS